MRRERHIGYEIKALSNLMRRKMWEQAGRPDCDEFTEMQGMPGTGIRRSSRRRWRRCSPSGAPRPPGC